MAYSTGDVILVDGNPCLGTRGEGRAIGVETCGIEEECRHGCEKEDGSHDEDVGDLPIAHRLVDDIAGSDKDEDQQDDEEKGKGGRVDDDVVSNPHLCGRLGCLLMKL